MSTDLATSDSVAERIRSVLSHLGITRANFAGRLPTDWAGLAGESPDLFASLILVCPLSVDVRAAALLGPRLMVLNGDHGPVSDRIRGLMPQLSQAKLVTIPQCNVLGWADLAADFPRPIGDAMVEFLPQSDQSVRLNTVCHAQFQGELEGVSYRIRGSGPPLVLLPLFLSPSQWEPIIARLAERYCTITLSGTALGAVAILESRGRSVGYRRMLQSLLDQTDLKSGESILEVGCGTGVIDRWLAERTDRMNRIVGVDINQYLLQEARRLARKEGLEGIIEFRDGDAQRLPVPDASFDLAISVTAIEEVNANQLLTEMARVVKPGGRVAVISRSIDIPYVRNVKLPPELKAKVDAPNGNVAPDGCADGSLYARMVQAGLTAIKKFPQLASFDGQDTTVLQFMEDGFMPKLTPDEVKAWRAARAEAEAEGTFFMSWPHHCAVGTKP